MSARVLTFPSQQAKTGHFSVLKVKIPERAPEPIGIVLLDPERDELYVKLRQNWEAFADFEDIELLRVLEGDLTRQAGREGSEAVLADLEKNSSWAVEASNREAIAVKDFSQTLEKLYNEYLPQEVLPFQTHLPLYSLAVAAGAFLANQEVEQKDWIKAPANLKLDKRMFVARIQGKSMEPFIPDGSLCVFRHGVVGSRNGRKVLVEDRGSAVEDKYTVKEYWSEKKVTEDGFAQNAILLKSLNPNYPSLHLDPDEDKYRVIAEFVSVLPEQD